jgi:hypothetical protein
MRILRLLLILLLMPLLARAASPTYGSFLSTQFTNNGVVIGLNTNYVLTWQMVSTNSFTTNGNNLAINTNTFPTLAVVLNLLSSATNGLTTNYWTLVGTNIARPSGMVSVGTTNTAPGVTLLIDGTDRGVFTILTTNRTGQNRHYLGLEAGGTAYSDVTSGGAGNASFSAMGGLYAYLGLISRSNSAGNTTVLLVNGDNRTYTDIGGRNALSISNAATTGTLIVGADGIVRFQATGGGIGFPDFTRQFTSATNAVRVFGLGGITASPSNNTANGSIDYRLSSAGDTNFPHINVTNGVLYGTSLWTASSDTTNFILNPALNERTINMAADVRVISVSGFNPAGFRGFVGVLITNNSGSSFNFDVTNTIVPFGTNTLTIPTGKAARVVFQIDENRAFWGGAVQP